MAFTLTTPVRFGDCDFAGIGYYPRLLALVDAAIEDWTEAAIGISRTELHGTHRRGLPTASLSVRFLTPCRLGEQLSCTVRVTELGTSSISLNVVAAVDGDLRFEADLAQVLIDLTSGRPVPWPEDWRARLRSELD
jgi:4-hydroxybenzoyl-CoA thioesterase